VKSLNRTLARAGWALSLVLVWGSCLAAEELLLGAGDVVRIAVYGQNDLGTVARIGNSGEITFPLIGEVAIAGLSTREAENAIASMLERRNIVRDPQVTLFIEQRQSIERDTVTILGQVKVPGKFPVETPSQGGTETIVGLLALAGGVTDSAADRLILTRSEGGEQRKLEVDLVALLKNGDLTQNHSLLAGDVVLVPRMDVFYVYGEVHNPGRFRLERDMTVMQAIAVSGGLTPGASEKDLTLKRRVADKIESYDVELTQVLKPEDVLYVKASLF
jgi:polysaccharide biosynthesis/export protein